HSGLDARGVEVTDSAVRRKADGVDATAWHGSVHVSEPSVLRAHGRTERRSGRRRSGRTGGRTFAEAGSGRLRAGADRDLGGRLRAYAVRAGRHRDGWLLGRDAGVRAGPSRTLRTHRQVREDVGQALAVDRLLLEQLGHEVVEHVAVLDQDVERLLVGVRQELVDLLVDDRGDLLGVVAG